VRIYRGQVVCYFTGLRLSVDVINERTWEENTNTLCLRCDSFDEADADEIVLDVPPHLSSATTFRATLGHKANHAADNNAEFEFCQHPRFGDIKCLRTTRALAAGEEVTVDYGYGELVEHDPPRWFKDRYG